MEYEVEREELANGKIIRIMQDAYYPNPMEGDMLEDMELVGTNKSYATADKGRHELLEYVMGMSADAAAGDIVADMFNMEYASDKGTWNNEDGETATLLAHCREYGVSPDEIARDWEGFAYFDANTQTGFIRRADGQLVSYSEDWVGMAFEAVKLKKDNAFAAKSYAGYSQGDYDDLILTAPKAVLKECWGVDTDAALESTLSAYCSWAIGDCYGFIIEDKDGDELDSCWGFVGDLDYCMKEARDAAK